MRFIVYGSLIAGGLFAGTQLVGSDAPQCEVLRPADAGVVPDAQAEREQPLLERAKEFVAAYNAHDAARLAALFAPDAEIITADGDRYAGREVIQGGFEAIFADNDKIQASLAIESIRFLTDDVAIEEGEFTSFADGETPSSQSLYSIVHVRRDGQWLMSSARTVRDEPLSAHERLQPLEWLVGEWIDEGVGEVVHGKCQWSELETWLLMDYEIQREGEVVLKGTQRIGWDPRTKQIRSWAFEDDGGYAEATWHSVEGEWLVKTNGTSAEGITGSMTRILRPDGPDRYVLSIVDRIVDDELLPDVHVTLVRKPPAPQPVAETE